jgi:hypothetical protein
MQHFLQKHCLRDIQMFKYRVLLVVIESRLEYRFVSFALARYNIVYRWSVSCVDL